MKNQLSEPAILSPFDKDRNTYLYTVAEGMGGMGYILIQEEEGSKKKLFISTGSTRLPKAQKRYSTTELELAAIVWAVK